MDIEAANRFVPGFAMGIVRAVISHPFEVLKLRTQMDIHAGKFNNLSNGIHLSILSNSIERGVQFFYFNDALKKSNSMMYASLYSSLVSTAITLPYNVFMLQRVILDRYSRVDPRVLFKGGSLEYARNLAGSTLFMYMYNKLKSERFPIYACAVVSSVGVWTVTYPVDNIKNQILTGKPIQWTGKFLYRGIEYPLLRSIPSSIVGLYVYEYLNKHLNPDSP